MPSSTFERADAAYGKYAWADAYAHLSAADKEKPLDAGHLEQAALAAAWCAFGCLTRGEAALGGGWLGRAQALCDEHDLDCAARWFVHGQIAAGAMFGGAYDTAITGFTETQREADRIRDPNGMTLSRLGRGQCLANLGRPAAARRERVRRPPAAAGARKPALDDTGLATP